MTRTLALLVLLLAALPPATARAGTPVDAMPRPAEAGPLAPPTRDAVFAIPEPLQQAFRRDVLEATRSPEGRLQKLVEFVFDERKLGVQYRADLTRTIGEAYAAREVNCLTSTLLLVALARQAGLRAHGQQVQQVLAWGANGDIAIQSRHANAVIEVGGRRYTVDVNAREGTATHALHPIDDDRLLALFHGNRAMELLVGGRLADARPSMEAALRLAPDDAGLLNNAGVIALRSGDASAAERLFLRAAQRNPREMSALSNLIALYEARGDGERAGAWKARADTLLRKDPYYQYSLGLKLEQAGHHAQAAAHYRRAIRLNPNEHLFQFALARAHAGMGNRRAAEYALAMAQSLSEGDPQSRYRGKLAALRNAGR
ncbi:hypothetical protein MASR1M8_20140 [Thermomonas brevis]